MKITLSPVRMDSALTAFVTGDVLTLNGMSIDLSGVSEDRPLEEHTHPWIVGPVIRRNTMLELTLILPHGGNPPHETLFPDMITVTSGQVPLPPFNLPDAMPEPE